MREDLEPVSTVSGPAQHAAQAGGAASYRRAARHVALLLALLVAALIAVGQVHGLNARFSTHGFDFAGTLWQPGRDVLDGDSPYRPPTDESMATGNPSVYPPFAFLVTLPVAALPFDVAYGIWALVLVAAVVAALRVVGLRDWRCYAFALLSPPVVQGVYLGNITLLLLLPLAAAWRWRDRPLGGGCALAAAVAVKPFLLLVVAWLLITRRFRAALVACAASAGLIVLSWGAIGFDGMRSYPELVRALDETFSLGTDSLPAALSWLSTDANVRQVVFLLGALGFVGLTLLLHRGRYGDERAFGAMVCGAVVAAPIVWPHYVAFLFVPLAIVRPRLGWVWFLPYLLPPIWAIDDRAARAALVTLLTLVLGLAAVELGRGRRPVEAAWVSSAR